jgi:hypothetical protein
MVTFLRQHQKQQKEQSTELRLIERNSALAGAGALKAQLITTARSAGISPRMVQAEESNDSSPVVDESKPSDVQMKRATVTLQRVNLSQLKNFLQGVEFGNFSMEVSSIKIRNDEKIRGYMDVDLGVVAYLFNSGGGEEP